MQDPMLQVIPGDPKNRKSNVLKTPDLEQHLKAMEAEFIGKPRVLYELVSLIIKIRRKNNLAQNVVTFTDLLGRYTNVIIDNADVRWLVSICDTIADHGDDIMKPRAMMIVNYVNMIKLNDTLLTIVKDPNIDGDKKRNFKVSPTWAGLTSFDIEKGDMTKNMFRRLENVLKDTPLLKQIFLKIQNEVKQNNNSLTTLAKIHKSSFWK